ncbi:MAG TPA: class I SAM-dependent methyltransferase [Polyangiaceae bacterium]
MSFAAFFAPFPSGRILLDRADVLVVDKPAPLVVHGGDVVLAGDLVSRLREFLRARGDHDYLGVHQRLDVGTSGVLFFTRDAALNADVARQFEWHELERVYVAAVTFDGPRCPLAKSGVLEHQLDTSGGSTRVVKRGGKRALTRYRLRDARAGRALVELRPETGRTHQLRAQLAHVGAAIIGDREYGGLPAFRLMLHAERLALASPELAIEAAVPEEILESVRGVGPTLPSGAGLRRALVDAGSLRYPLVARTESFRVVNDLGDGLPGVVVDRYGEFAVLSLASESAAARSQELAELLAAHGARGVYLKQRARTDLRRAAHAELAPPQPILGESAPSELVVSESGRRFAVALGDGLSTGLFLDQRDNRARMAELCGGARVLNLFCYTGSFSVYAALGGASHVTSVDLSARALARGKANFELNQLDPAQHAFVRADALEWLARASKRGARFDVVILDPPSFATAGKGKTFRAADGYERALALALSVLEPGGRLLAVTNHQKTSVASFRKTAHAAARAAGLELAQLKDLPSPLDCPAGPDGPFPAKSMLITLK